MTNVTLKSKMRQTAYITAVVIVGLGFSACAKNFSDYVGISKQSPDESKVTTNRPLSVPPDYSLRPPSDNPQQNQSVVNVPAQNQPLALNAPPPNQPAPDTQTPDTQTTGQDRARPIAPRPAQVERKRALRERAAAQPAQRQATPTTPPQQVNTPTTLGQQPATTPTQPRKRLSDAEYKEKIAQARKDDLARRRTKNPNYGTWRNVWKSVWE